MVGNMRMQSMCCLMHMQKGTINSHHNSAPSIFFLVHGSCSVVCKSRERNGRIDGVIGEVIKQLCNLQAQLKLNNTLPNIHVSYRFLVNWLTQQPRLKNNLGRRMDLHNLLDGDEKTDGSACNKVCLVEVGPRTEQYFTGSYILMNSDERW